jgi:hypothetical protein
MALRINDTQYCSISCHYAECNYAKCFALYSNAECHNAECRYAECRGAKSLGRYEADWEVKNKAFITCFGPTIQFKSFNVQLKQFVAS